MLEGCTSEAFRSYRLMKGVKLSGRFNEFEMICAL